MKVILSVGTQVAVEFDGVEVTEVKVKDVKPEPGDHVSMLVEGRVRQVIGDEVEIEYLTVTRVLEVRREAS